MGICVRVTVLIFLLIGIGCAVASCLTDVFRYRLGDDILSLLNAAGIPSTGLDDARFHVQYFELSVTAMGVKEKDKDWALGTKDCKDRLTIAGALCAAGGGVALIALIMEAVYLACDNSCCLSCLIMVLAFIAFGCEAASFALSITAVKGDKRPCPLFKDGYMEGFALAVVASGVFLLAMFLQLCA
ncbi:hypothetical protein ADEAN_000038800 [Angomonas deanei]|uniref:Amastin surface glycoprotein n=1 Tax=Angomonas deanei TaxID=59799 RepID=A0A7G2C4Y6_9TRYP|nr:hypothetical protein ADEAN_000038800 [Angomonas deanei]